jgi:hypothetical protein
LYLDFAGFHNPILWQPDKFDRAWKPQSHGIGKLRLRLFFVLQQEAND